MLVSKGIQNRFLNKKSFNKFLFIKKNILLILSFTGLLSISTILFFPLDFLSRDNTPSKRFLRRAIVESINLIDKRYGFIANETIDYGGNFFSIVDRYLKSSFINKENIQLNIDMDGINKLNSIRKKAIDNGILVRTNNDQVKGSITYKNQTYPIRIRLKGDWTDHLLGDKWSFRVQMRKDKAFLGIKEFSFQHPRTRNYISEFIFHKFLKYENLPYLRYSFEPLSINGNYLGIYAIEEHFTKNLIENSGFREGPIIKLSESDLRNQYLRMQMIDKNYNFLDVDQNNSDISSFNINKLKKNQSKIYQFRLARNLLDKYLKNELETSDVFDIKRLAKYFAISDLLQTIDSNTWRDMRFYFDPISSRLTPIGYDASPPIKNYSRQLSIDKNVLNLFEDKKFVIEYLKELHRVSKKEYLDNFFEKFDKQINQNISLINKSYPHVKNKNNEILLNQKYISERLLPVSTISLDFSDAIFDTESGNLKLNIKNKTIFPIDIVEVIVNQISYKPFGDDYLPAKKKLSRAPKKEFIFKLNKEDINKKLLAQVSLKNQVYSIPLDIKYKFSSTSELKSFKTSFLPKLKNEEFSNPIILKKTNYKEFAGLSINDLRKEINIKNNMVFEKPLILPKGYKLIIAPNINIELIKGGLIIVQGPINIKGEKNKNVNITSSNSGKGILILDSEETSKISYSNFIGLKAPLISSLNITGGLTFYNSKVIIENSRFLNNFSEDALNLVRSPFSITDTYFENIFSDALDVDFSNGEIKDSSFMKINNDAIDISGADVAINNVMINYAKDKAISVGEAGTSKINNVNIKNSFIGIASKDLSNVKMKNFTISNSEICFAAYQKKSEYGPGFISLENNKKSCSKYLLEIGSTILNQSEKFRFNTLNAYEKLYPEENESK